LSAAAVCAEAGIAARPVPANSANVVARKIMAELPFVAITGFCRVDGRYADRRCGRISTSIEIAHIRPESITQRQNA
jgi:hypothetical protein